MSDLVNEVVNEFHDWLRKKGAETLKQKKKPMMEPQEMHMEMPPGKMGPPKK